MRIKSALSIVLILTSLSVLVSGVLTMINGDVDHSVLGGTVSIIVGVSSIMTVTGGNIRPRPGKALPLLANIVCIVFHGVALSVKIPGEPSLWLTWTMAKKRHRDKREVYRDKNICLTDDNS